MVLDIVTWDGFDFAFATSGDDVIIMADLPSEQLDRLQSSPLTDVIDLVGGDKIFVLGDVSLEDIHIQNPLTSPMYAIQGNEEGLSKILGLKPRPRRTAFDNSAFLCHDCPHN
ncbi:hypothetical protein AY600_06535 [Phormidium willei BDU 130791]|nr:hypothetical protein AY600_06535 [Phormidium willei BDU 130791]